MFVQCNVLASHTGFISIHQRGFKHAILLVLHLPVNSTVGDFFNSCFFV